MELCNERHERSRKAICLLCFAPSERVIQKDSNLERLVREFVITGYFVEDQRLPWALCASCRKKLQQFHKGNFDRYLPEFPDCVQFHRQQHCKNEEDSVQEAPPKKAISICLDCFSLIYQGCGVHDCSKRGAIKNLRKIVPAKTLEQVASQILNEKANDSNVATLSTTAGKPNHFKKMTAKEMNSSPPPLVKLDTIDEIVQDANLSQRQAFWIIYVTSSS